MNKPPPKPADTASGAPPEAALARIREIVGAKGWSDDPDKLAPHLEEPRGLWHGATALLVEPASTEELAAVVAVCDAFEVPIVPQGGNTGLVGGSVPHEHGGEIVLGLSRINRVRDVDPLNDTITVEAGCILANVQAAAEEVGRLFPLSLGAEGTCQIGGNLSTNAGGTAVLRYGNARSLVLGLEAVLPDGRIWDGLRGLRKDNTGYDLKQLFIGGEGTLGIITAAVLRLFPLPKERITALAGVAAPQAAVELLSELRDRFGDTVTACEIMSRFSVGLAVAHIEGVREPLAETHPWYLLVELSVQDDPDGTRGRFEQSLAAAHEGGLIADANLAQSGRQGAEMWRLREAVVEGQKFAGGSIKHDISVPVSRVPEFIEKADAAIEAALPGIRPCTFGHIGDGNLHYNLSQPEGMEAEAYLAEWARINRVVHDVTHALGGSISAEHGLGRLKRDEIVRYKSETELEMMRAIKRSLDPKGIMNPGKVI